MERKQNPNTGEWWVYDGRQWRPERPLPQSKPDEPNYAAGLGKQALQGASFGWSDEAIAAGRAGIDSLQGYPFKESYQRNLDEENRDMAAFQGANPGSAIAAEIGGSIATGAGLGKQVAQRLPQAATVLGRVGQYMGLGAAEGAAYGAGQAKDNRATGAAVGGLVGAAVAPVATLGVAAVSRAYNGWLKPLAEKIATTPEQQAEMMVARAMQSSGLTPQQAMQALQEMGDDAALMHLGPYLERLTYQTQAGTGPGVKIINESIDRIQSGQQGRILSAAGVQLGHADQARGFMETIRNAKSELAAPLYARAHQANIRTNPQFEKLMEGVPSEAIKRAERLARTEYYAGIDIPGLDRGVPGASVRISPQALPAPPTGAGSAAPELAAPRSSQARGMVGELADEVPDGFSFDALPDVLRIDYIKRAMDDIIGGLYQGKEKQYAAALIRLRSKMLDFVDNQVPDFKKARGIWAGASQIEAAEKLGRDVFTEAPDEIAEVVQRLGAGEKQAYRLGVSQAVRDKVESAGETHDAVKRLLNSAANKRRLRAAFDNDEAFDEFMKKLRAESVFSSLRRNVQGGSQTHSRALAGEETGQIPLGKADALNMLVRGMGPQPPLANPHTNQAVANMLTGRNVPAQPLPNSLNPADRMKYQMIAPLIPFALNPGQ